MTSGTTHNITAPSTRRMPAKASVQGATEATIPLGRQVQSWRQGLIVVALILSDVGLTSLFFALAVVLQGLWGENPISGEQAVSYLITSTMVWIVARALLGLYPGYGLSTAEELRRQTYAAVASPAMVAVLALGTQTGDYLSRLLVGLLFLERLILAPLGRYFVKRGLAKVGLWGKAVVILGAGQTGRNLMRTLKGNWQLGYNPVGVFDFRLAPRGGRLEDMPYKGTVTDALELARKRRIDTVIFAMPHIRREHLARFVDSASRSFRHVVIIPNLSEITTSAVKARDFAGTLGVETKHNLLDPWAQRAKRTLDLFGVVVGGLLISPLLLAIVALIKLEDPSGPVLYKPRRLGAGGKYFYCLKFRTMSVDAELLLTELLKNDPELREEWEREQKLRNDPRITQIGRFLRKTSLDELPQLWNVLRGDMSLVGPRPIPIEEIPKYGEVYEQYQRMRPGMTGLWQASGRSNIGYKERLVLVAYYVRNWSVWLDLIILARTVVIVFLGRGAV